MKGRGVFVRGLLALGSTILASLLVIVLQPTAVFGQGGTGTITGVVADEDKGALPGAQITLEPTKVAVVTDNQGRYAISGVAAGDYEINVSYVGFKHLETNVKVTPGQNVTVNIVLQVASAAEQVLVTAPQASGVAEAINLVRSTSNILDVLPAKLIESLPNANVADAVGRLPSVTLERDEGEGKYVQIRGTEPRLSNLTVDGVPLPSPEGGVRQIKLDTIPADLVQSVQIFKTLEADQPGDAIGGSVNLETKKAGDEPVLSLFGLGGFTPIANTVPVYQFGATGGYRFGREKRFGVMLSGSYDYNGRGIDDIEPVPCGATGTTCALTTSPATFSAMDVRQYVYDRRRWGIGGDADYRLSSSASLYIHTLYSDFKDYGNRYDYALATNDGTPLGSGTNLPSFNTERRDGHFQLGSIIVGGSFAPGKWGFRWEASVARAQMLNPINGGESIDSFNFVPATSNCQNNPAATTNKFLPQFTADCFTEMYNPANFSLATIAQTNHGKASQLNLQGSADVSRTYALGSHPGVFQLGGWFSNAHKFDNSYENDFTPSGTILASQFLNGFTNSNYYGGAYPYGPGVSYDAIKSFLASNPGLFTMTTTQGGNPNNFDLVEKISAGYLMNTLNLGRFNIITGVRFEGTQDNTVSFDTTAAVPCLCVKGTNSYVDVLPSASVQVKLDTNSDIRLAYGRGLNRPDPQWLTTAISLDQSTFPPTVTEGNPAIKAEHANNYDVLYERFLEPIGMIRAGFFYKSVSSPIVNVLAGPEANPFCPQVTCFVSHVGNAGSAYITGLELSFQQHFTYLPGLLRGLGIFANYSYSASQAKNVIPGRTDNPALLRQAPNAWNINPTFDFRGFSVGAALTYDGPNIYQYAYITGNPGGITGPQGDLYLFKHFQVDLQGSYRIGRGLTAVFQIWNLNNEPFGFYNGSEQFFIQREYYKQTYMFGVRWDLPHKR